MAAAPPAFKVVKLRIEHHLALPSTNRVVGIGESRPRLSWEIRGAPEYFKQLGIELQIRDGEDADSQVLTTAEVKTNSSTLIDAWPAQYALTSGKSYCVRVRAFGKRYGPTRESGGWTIIESEPDKMASSEWSEWEYVEAGLLSRQDWVAKRISAPFPTDGNGDNPTSLFYKRLPQTFDNIKSARIYLTSQGVYKFWVNGRSPTDFMNPGWTAFNERLLYQVFDITEDLKKSSAPALFAVEVAEGWFTGRLTINLDWRNLWGDRTALICQVHVTLTDGTTHVYGSDESWKVAKGPCVHAELYDGEKYDARIAKALSQDMLRSENYQYFLDPEVLDPLGDEVALEATHSGPMRPKLLVKPIEKIITPSGQLVFDFGQNLVGYIRIKGVKGNPGDCITLKHAEALEDGEMCTRILRTAKCTDTYTLAGTGNGNGENYEPKFTFHGFRYLQVEGWPEGDIDNVQDRIEAVVIYTDMKSAGDFKCSDPMLQRLHSNILWSMRGNFLSVPTDCPQRDERLGWTGDIAVFIGTGVYLYDCVALLKSWLKDVAIDQNGLPRVVSPDCLIHDPMWTPGKGSAIWNDAIVIVPWALYKETSDITILADFWPSMIEYLRAITRDGEHTALWSAESFQFGDWLDPAAPAWDPSVTQTDPHLVADAFLINTLNLMVDISKVLGKETELGEFQQWRRDAKAQFQALFLTPNGRLSSDSQTAYSLALVFDIFDSVSQRVNAGKRLAWLVHKNKFRIGTGFAGTAYVLEALVLTGHTQTAYRMLLERECPSWLYPITMGGTTMWERWDSMLPSGKVNIDGMTSFNHYALGGVGRFFYEYVAGLRCLEPGWTRCRVQPVLGGGLTTARAEHVAIHGRIVVEWEIVGKEGTQQTFRLHVQVPVGTTMEIFMPQGVVGLGELRDRPKLVAHGAYKFEVPFDAALMPAEDAPALPPTLPPFEV